MFPLKTKHLLSLGLGIVLSILAFMVLNIRSARTSFLKEKGFVRVIKNDYVNLVKKTKLPPDTYSILGVLQGKVFVRSYNNASIIAIEPLDTAINVNGTNGLSKVYKLGYSESNSIALNSDKTEINVFNSVTKTLIVLDANDFKVKYRVTFNTDFTRASKAGNYVLVASDSAYQSIFKLYRIRNNHVSMLVKSINILKGTSMSEDGILKSDDKGLFAYVSFYKNSFWFIDTLARTNAHRTIDTIATGPKTALIMNDSRMVYTEPVRLTNSNFHFMNGQLGIESVVASNTSYENIKENNIVDFYNRSGKYLYSLSLSGEYKIRPKDIFIQGEFLYVLSGNQLFTYKMKLSS